MTHVQASKSANGGPFKRQDPQKLRGGYYTSVELAAWLCDWAVREETDRVLEPSCGDGVFLEETVKRFAKMSNGMSSIGVQLQGIEIIESEAEVARERLRPHFGSDSLDVIHTGDFFQWWQQNRAHDFDAVVGNPPFIRYQNFPEEFRGPAFDIMVQLGLKPNRLTNIWVPFVVASTASLRPGGRLALILPAELLQVTYAGQLREFLAQSFSTIDIVACNELFFNRAEQEVILVLADGFRGFRSRDDVCRITMTEFDTVRDIVRRPPSFVLASRQTKTIFHDSEKWLKYLLTPGEIQLMRELRESPEFTSLSTHASVDVGVVTGRNSFFVLTTQQIEDMGIAEYTIPLVSRSKQLRGVCIGKREWAQLAAAGDRVHLLHLAPFTDSPMEKSLEDYLRMGEADGVHEGYKCSIRSPWYAVPSVWEPRGFLLRQIYDFPRIVLNDARATSTDTIHRLNCSADPSRLVSNSYTYLTGASAEIEGRSYGGGVLELEPTEAERLLIPTELAEALPIETCDDLVRSGYLKDLLMENSKRVLVDSVGLSMKECDMLRQIWDRMRNRRHSRGRRRRRTDVVNL